MGAAFNFLISLLLVVCLTEMVTAQCKSLFPLLPTVSGGYGPYGGMGYGGYGGGWGFRRRMMMGMYNPYGRALLFNYSPF